MTLWFLSTLHTAPDAMNAIIKQALGYVLFATAMAILFKKRLLEFAHKRAGGNYNPSGARLNAMTVITGLILGTMVALTSIGAGALGTVALFILYPLLPTRRLVGTEIAHAVPLTLVAASATRAWATWTGACWAFCWWARCRASGSAAT